MAWFPTDQNQTGAPGRQLRVFVSAAQNELAAERSAVRQVVARLRLTPVMFESSSRPHPPRDLYRTYLVQSDVFIGMYWQQYGDITPGEAFSALEDEYRLSSDIPRLIYIKTPAPQREDRLKDMLAWMKQAGPVVYRYFSTTEALAGLVENDLALLLTGQFAQHWPTRDAGQRFQPGPSNNLPVETDRFIGREIQVDAIRRLLLQPENRLVSLTGPGGIGKTRLALKAAAAALEHFPGGVFFLDLSRVDDPVLVLPAIARALGEPEAAGEQIQEKMTTRLRNQNILLVLDNLEQNSAAAPAVGKLLDTAPGLKVLTTSLSALHMPGEMEFPVPPLGLPNPAHRAPEAIAQSEAVQLFIDRAGSSLEVTAGSAALIAEICRRLAGLPLAIELAAARAAVLPPAALLEGLTGCLKLLPGGPLSGQEPSMRRQILNAVMEWSCRLLPPEGQTLFARLAVFPGGCALEAVETVCSLDNRPERKIDVLEVSGILVSNHLVQRALDTEGRLRFTMLDTLRDFAQERLYENGETAAIQERHARCYLAAVKEAVARYSPDDQTANGLDRLDAEIENLRAALAWSLTVPGSLEAGGRLANHLFWFWGRLGRLSEGQAWYRRFIQSDIRKDSPVYVGLLARAGILANALGDPGAARLLLDESISSLRGIGDRQEFALALLNRGMIALDEGRPENAHADLEEALALFRGLGQRYFTGLCLMHLAGTALALNRPDTARKQLAETAAIARTIGNRWLLAAAVNNQGEVARFQNDYSRAGGCYDESGALFHEINAYGDLARIYHNQAYVALQRGDTRLANSLFRQGLGLYRQLGIRRGAAECLAGLADVDAAQGRLMPAARLLGFAQVLIVSLGMQWAPADRREIERLRASLQNTLGEDLLNLEEAAGRSQEMEDILKVYQL